MKVLIIHGPNLNLLGIREKEVYGKADLNFINKEIKEEAVSLGLEVDIFQSNHEGQIIDKLHNTVGGAEYIIINPGAYTHYSYAIRDAIAGIRIPVIEVHITNIYQREEFRQKSVIAPVCIGQISGFSYYSYILALHAVRYGLRGE